MSEAAIGSPLVTEPPVLVAKNKTSLVKFMPKKPKNGILLYNSSLIEDVEIRKDVQAYPITCNQIGEEVGNPRTANMAMLGAVVGATKIVSPVALDATLLDFLGAAKANLLSVNRTAIELGQERIHP